MISLGNILIQKVSSSRIGNDITILLFLNSTLCETFFVMDTITVNQENQDTNIWNWIIFANFTPIWPNISNSIL